jgi:hypothetical protein
MPCRLHGKGLIWGILPIGSSFLAILFVWLLVEPRRIRSSSRSDASAGNAGKRLCQWGALMKWGWLHFSRHCYRSAGCFAWLQSGGLKQHAMFSAATPEEAVQALMSQIQAHNYQQAYASLDRSSDTDLASFIREMAGSDGSLRTYSSLQTAEVSPAARRW